VDSENEETNLESEKLTAIHLALEHFLLQIIKANFTSILIRTDNTSTMYRNWFPKPLYDNQKNIVFDKSKRDGFEFQEN
jgi:hypothetical protein